MKLWWGLLWGTLACAADAVPPAAATLLALDGGPGAGVPACIDRFTGEEARIPAIFLRAPDATPVITADVYLDGGALAAPWKTGVRFEAAPDPSHPGLLEGAFIVPLPNPDQITFFRVTIVATEDRQGTKLAEFGLRLTPPGELRQILTVWLRPTEHRPARHLALFGALPGLREMLREWQIAFHDHDATAPANIPSGTLAIGEEASPPGESTIAVDDGASLLLFEPTLLRPGGILQKHVSSRSLTLVNGTFPPGAARQAAFHQLLLTHLRLHPSHE